MEVNKTSPVKISARMLFPRKYLLAYIVIFVFTLIFGIVYLAHPAQNVDSLEFFVLGLLLFLIVIAVRWIELTKNILSFFAESKGLKKDLSFKYPREHKQSIFALGSKRKIHTRYANDDGSRAIEMVRISRGEELGENDYSFNFGNFTIISTRLSKKYPFAQAIRKNLVIKPKHIIKGQLHDSESIQFNEKYYFNADQPQDAYYVFNPTVIHAIIDLKGDFSVEVYEDALSLFSTTPVSDIKTFESIWQTMEKIHDALE